MNNSGLDTDLEDDSSTCSDSGYVGKRRKINQAIQKIEQYLNQIHKDSIKLTERILALEEQSLQKLSEMLSTLPTLASFIMNTEISKAVAGSGRIN